MSDGERGRGRRRGGDAGVGGRPPVAFATGLILIACAGAIACTGAEPAPPVAPRPVPPEEAVAVFDTAWARIQRTYYDSTFRGLDWDGVRAELRPLARGAGTTDSLRAILRTMLTRIGDSHFAIIPAEIADALDPDSIAGIEGEPGDVGIEIRVLDDRAVVSRVRPGTPGDRAGIRTGWILESVEGKPTAGLLAALDELDHERRLATARLAWALEARLAGSVGDTIEAAFRDAGEEAVETTLLPVPRDGTPTRFGNLPTQFTRLDYRRVPLGDGCAGVIRFNIWMTPILPEFDEAFQALRDCDGMVLDIRGNPGGVGGLSMAISGYFMDERKPLGHMRTRDTELNLVTMPRRVTADGDPMQPYAGPLAILVDGQSVSTSEIFAGGLQGIGRARIFGEVTSGQALPALMGRLPNRDVLMHAFADYVGPDGTRIEGRGVEPDEVVPLTREDLLAGVDGPLEAALRWIGQDRGATH